ncbi:MAG TPA: hypothetical protein DCL54_01570, partial [Alphaproteobacteria bacterium]|nr:hypothetical protein [Alphaproteobacteria bacterium]
MAVADNPHQAMRITPWRAVQAARTCRCQHKKGRSLDQAAVMPGQGRALFHCRCKVGRAIQCRQFGHIRDELHPPLPVGLTIGYVSPTRTIASRKRSVMRNLCLSFLGALFMATAAFGAPFEVKTVAQGLDHPWGMAFLPNGDILVTERAGRLRVIRNGVLDTTPIAGTPPTFVASQGGYFDIVLHPKFAENNWVYLTFAHGERGANATRVVRAVFDGKALTDLKAIFTADPAKASSNHYGGRLAFLPDGTFLLTVGDGFDTREQAQNLNSHLGKIVRLNDDGSIPADNPFVGQAGKKPEIWSYGHRNQQGLAVDPRTGTVYEHEHGPRGGDEINIIEKGANYGWPLVSGMREDNRFVKPLLEWTPAIAP